MIFAIRTGKKSPPLALIIAQLSIQTIGYYDPQKSLGEWLVAIRARAAN